MLTWRELRKVFYRYISISVGLMESKDKILAQRKVGIRHYIGYIPPFEPDSTGATETMIQEV